MLARRRKCSRLGTRSRGSSKNCPSTRRSAIGSSSSSRRPLGVIHDPGCLEAASTRASSLARKTGSSGPPRSEGISIVVCGDRTAQCDVAGGGYVNPVRACVVRQEKLRDTDTRAARFLHELPNASCIRIRGRAQTRSRHGAGPSRQPGAWSHQLAAEIAKLQGSRRSSATGDGRGAPAALWQRHCGPWFELDIIWTRRSCIPAPSSCPAALARRTSEAPAPASPRRGRRLRVREPLGLRDGL